MGYHNNGSKNRLGGHRLHREHSPRFSGQISRRYFSTPMCFLKSRACSMSGVTPCRDGQRSTGPKQTARFWLFILLASAFRATRFRWSNSTASVVWKYCTNQNMFKNFWTCCPVNNDGFEAHFACGFQNNTNVQCGFHWRRSTTIIGLR